MSLTQKSSFSKKRHSLLLNQKGQGIIEYILILIVTVSLVLGLVLQFNRAFKVFVESYMGDYVSCLLETGELPNLGKEQNENSICDATYEPFSITNGRPGVGEGIGGGSKDDSSEKNNNARRQKKSKRVGARRGGGSINNTLAIGENNSSNRGGANGKKKRAQAKTGSSEAEEEDFFSTRANSSRRLRKKNKRIKAGGEDLFFVTKRTEDKKSKKKVAAQTEMEGEAAKPKRIPLNTQKKKKVIIKDDDDEFSFTNLIRMLIIIALALAILVFIGSQVLSIVKSSEK